MNRRRPVDSLGNERGAGVAWRARGNKWRLVYSRLGPAAALSFARSFAQAGAHTCCCPQRRRIQSWRPAALALALALAKTQTLTLTLASPSALALALAAAPKQQPQATLSPRSHFPSDAPREPPNQVHPSSAILSALLDILPDAAAAIVVDANAEIGSPLRAQRPDPRLMFVIANFAFRSALVTRRREHKHLRRHQQTVHPSNWPTHNLIVASPLIKARKQNLEQQQQQQQQRTIPNHPAAMRTLAPLGPPQ